MNRLNFDVCAVILNYNDYNNTMKLASKLKSYEVIHKIIIVDNNSTDNSFYLLKENFSNSQKIEVISSGKNGGYAFGNNIGIKYALSKYSVNGFLILNPDIEVQEMTISSIVKFVKQNSVFKIGIVGAKNNVGVSAWKLPSFWSYVILSSPLLTRIFGDPLIYNNNEIDQIQGFTKVDVLPGSFFFITSESIQDVGFFDEGTFLYCEESILAYKLRKKGYSNYLLTNVSFTHLESGSTRSLKFIKRYIMLQRSRKYFLTKYLNVNILGILLFWLVTSLGLFEFLMLSNLKAILKLFKRKKLS